MNTNIVIIASDAGSSSMVFVLDLFAGKSRNATLQAGIYNRATAKLLRIPGLTENRFSTTPADHRISIRPSTANEELLTARHVRH